MKWFLSAVFLLNIVVSYAEVSVISDLDDTIKITHVANPASATYNGIFSKKVFAGMPELLKEMRLYIDKLHILTASPGIIKKSVLRTLNSNLIEYETVAFKNPLKFENKIDYKVRKITSILSESDNQFILIGDDVDKDPEIFRIIMDRFPDKILASYIHIVRNREIPNGMTTYFTAADLALREMLSGRMHMQSAEVVLDRLLAEDNLKYVLPKFAFCPKNSDVWKWQAETELSYKAAEFTASAVRHCLN